MKTPKVRNVAPPLVTRGFVEAFQDQQMLYVTALDTFRDQRTLYFTALEAFEDQKRASHNTFAKKSPSVLVRQV